MNLLVMGMCSARPVAVVPPVFNPKRWTPESPYEMPKKDKDGRVLGPLVKNKQKPRSFDPVTFLHLDGTRGSAKDGGNATADKGQEELLMNNLFFNMNAYVESAFDDILLQNESILQEGSDEGYVEEDNGALDAVSLDNSKPFDVPDDATTLKLKQAALKDMAFQVFHLADPSLAFTWQYVDRPAGEKVSRRKGGKNVPKGLFVPNRWVMSRYEKIPFTKMSVKKWKKVASQKTDRGTMSDLVKRQTAKVFPRQFVGQPGPAARPLPVPVDSPVPPLVPSHLALIAIMDELAPLTDSHNITSDKSGTDGKDNDANEMSRGRESQLSASEEEEGTLVFVTVPHRPATALQEGEAISESRTIKYKE
jgi:hypothetical protein